MCSGLKRKYVNIFVVFFWCVQCVCTLFIKYTPVLEVSEGRLRGFRGLNGQNRYYGIAYATSDRFQPAKPPRKWSGIFDAVLQFETCAQVAFKVHIGTEDCQKLDIYTPGHATESSKLPVLVFFHGGAFYYGAKWYYNPEFLVKKDVVVVMVNYRVGVLGFLCLNNVANLGLKDQLAALKWIQKNIAAFGGDPDNVTVSGQSAGASAASMHMLSKRSKGLFHKALLMSGVALSPWSFNLEPLTAAFEDANKLTRNRNKSDVYKTFLNAKLYDLLEATQGNSIDPKYFKYTPCVDTNLSDAFFHDTPYHTIKTGDFNKVPMMIGYTNLEGILFYSLNDEGTLDDIVNNLKDRLPSIFSWCSEEDRRRIADLLRSHYFKKRKLSSVRSIKGVVDFYSDYIAYASIDAFSKLMAKYSDKSIFNYIFTYEGNRNFIGVLMNRVGIKGVSHADDVFYLYTPGGITLPISRLDELIIERFSTMVTNFMKTGDPTPTTTELIPVRWLPITANKTWAMRIDDPLSVVNTPAKGRGNFLLDLMCKYGQDGYVPCDGAMQCNLDK